METVHEETNEEQGVREAMVAVGDSGSCIQLLAPLERRRRRSRSSSTATAPACSSWPTGSPTSRPSSAILRERGVRLLYDAPRRGTAGSLVNFVHPKDAGGVLVELVEPASDRLSSIGATQNPGTSSRNLARSRVPCGRLGDQLQVPAWRRGRSRAAAAARGALRSRGAAVVGVIPSPSPALPGTPRPSSATSDVHAAVLAADLDQRRGGVRVLDDVAQALPDDPVGQPGGALAEAELRVDVHLGVHLVRGLEHQVLDRRAQTLPRSGRAGRPRPSATAAVAR